ncbi:hypothetical protein JK185_12525 [Gluconobacter wancherniae]|uniref:hypothetical protein n=1 Tax=Gluconobacter wancherniae TaxID=1307955 RepID=UPI001B8C66B6|nr:hypothetical protein [Gluconobacter wancherniae]MBS1063843.1 hypothetical protein [Gluconobacter wancherniae]
MSVSQRSYWDSELTAFLHSGRGTDKGLQACLGMKFLSQGTDEMMEPSFQQALLSKNESSGSLNQKDLIMDDLEESKNRWLMYFGSD